MCLFERKIFFENYFSNFLTFEDKKKVGNGKQNMKYEHIEMKMTSPMQSHSLSLYVPLSSGPVYFPSFFLYPFRLLSVSLQHFNLSSLIRLILSLSLFILSTFLIYSLSLFPFLPTFSYFRSSLTFIPTLQMLTTNN